MLVTINIQQFLCTVINFHVVKEAIQSSSTLPFITNLTDVFQGRNPIIQPGVRLGRDHQKRLWGGGGRGIFKPPGCFLVFKFLVRIFFRTWHEYFLGLIDVHEFFSFNFPLREYFTCTSPAPAPISFLMVRPLIEDFNNRNQPNTTYFSVRVGLIEVSAEQGFVTKGNIRRSFRDSAQCPLNREVNLTGA